MDEGLADLAENPWPRFCGLNCNQRITRVAIRAAAAGKRATKLIVPLGSYVEIERFAMASQAAFVWHKDHITWRMMGGELDIYVGNKGTECHFGFDDGTGMEINIAIAREPKRDG